MLKSHSYWLVVWNMFYFSIQLGMSSSQLTKSFFFRGVGIPPTNQIYLLYKNSWPAFPGVPGDLEDFHWENAQHFCYTLCTSGYITICYGSHGPFTDHQKRPLSIAMSKNQQSNFKRFSAGPKQFIYCCMAHFSASWVRGSFT